jgi:integrase/recombinase XerD
MANIPWKGITRDVDEKGNVRYYFRVRGKPKIRLRGEPGSEEFALAYFAAKDGKPLEPVRPTAARRGTFDYLVRHYLASRDFRSLDRTLTQRPRELLLEKLVEKIGDKPAVIDPRTIRDAVKSRTFAQGKDFLSALRAVYKVACDDGLVETDPTKGVRRKKNTSEGHRTWTTEDCAAFEKRWPLGTQARTAYAIGLYTAQRVSDAVRIGRPHEKDGRLRFTQKKNEKTRPVFVDIPIVAPLREALNAWQGTDLTYLQTAYGRAFSEFSFGGKFKDWCTKAGTHPKCTFHGLRKAAAARMAEAGCTPHQIMAVLGHSTHQQAATYTAKAQRAGLATDALANVFGANVPAQNSAGTQKAKSAINSALHATPLAVPRGDA